jgi:hypothetical protein
MNRMKNLQAKIGLQKKKQGTCLGDEAQKFCLFMPKVMLGGKMPVS